MRTDVLVAGGGLGGVAAALSAAALGARVVLVEELDWLGGQLTSQGVPPDEHPWIETLVSSRSYADLRHRIREYYRRNYPLTAEARRRVPFNPGVGNVGTLCHEPRVSAAVLEEMLAPWVAGARVQRFMRRRMMEAHTQGDRIAGVTFQDLESGASMFVEAAIVIDATETGELLSLANVEHVCGGESQAATGELHALAGAADPGDQQAITWCLAADYFPGEDHTIDKPEGYEAFKTLQLECWPGAQFSWTLSDFITHQPRHRPLFAGDTDDEFVYDLWHARRIACRRSHAEGTYASDITLANWPQMDYWMKPVIGVSREEASAALLEARRFSLAFFHWMQADAPRHDGGTGYKGLRLRGDVLGTTDGLAKQAYYREGLRIAAEFTVLEQHIGVEARKGLTGAEVFEDSVGIGAYRIDLHPSTRGRNTVDIESYPFQIPLGALLPVRVDNLLPACKNLGTTRITNGAYRVHPVEWSIGEASGALAAFALGRKVPPRAVRADASMLAQFQQALVGLGVMLAWPVYGALTATHRTGYRPAGKA